MSNKILKTCIVKLVYEGELTNPGIITEEFVSLCHERRMKVVMPINDDVPVIIMEDKDAT